MLLQRTEVVKHSAPAAWHDFLPMQMTLGTSRSMAASHHHHLRQYRSCHLLPHHHPYLVSPAQFSIHNCRSCRLIMRAPHADTPSSSPFWLSGEEAQRPITRGTLLRLLRSAPSLTPFPIYMELTTAPFYLPPQLSWPKCGWDMRTLGPSIFGSEATRHEDGVLLDLRDVCCGECGEGLNESDEWDGMSEVRRVYSVSCSQRGEAWSLCEEEPVLLFQHCLFS